MTQSTEFLPGDDDFRESRRCEAEQAAHRATNDLYSATLTLRAVVTLLDQNKPEQARNAALKMLEKLTGSPS